MRLDKMGIDESVTLMLSEEARVPRILLRHQAPISKALRLIVRSLRSGGRLFYVGAGTSGRLGVLDASECPPTFGTSPEMVRGIIAGGEKALREAVEGAEDDREAGKAAMREAKVSPGDAVVGIAASGTTPYVWGALAEARERKATTILLCFNPHVRIPPVHRPRVVIAVDLGPEILTGSTRLKAGTATKLVLNLFSTLAMVRQGKVASNLMIDLKPTNDKLRGRALRMTQQLTGAPVVQAQAALERHAWSIKKAVAALEKSRRSPSSGTCP